MDGLNISMFEIMCHNRFPDQYKLYRKLRPHKPLDAIHMIDTSLAMRMNEAMVEKRAKMVPLNNCFIRAPECLLKYYLENQSLIEKEGAPEYIFRL